MNFLNSNSISAPISKLAELSEHYVINGQVYNKNKMTPIALQTIPIYSTSNTELNVYKTAYVNNYFGQSRINQTFLIDNNDPNVVYKVNQNYLNTNGNGATLIKITNNNGEFNYVYLPTKYTSHYAELDIISQDSNYIYCIMYYSNGYGYLVVINKKLWTVRDTVTMERSANFNVIRENESYIYLYASTHINYDIVYKFNKVTLGISAIMYIAKSGNYVASCICSLYDSVNNKFYSVYDGYADDTSKSAHYYIYKSQALDTVNDKVSQTKINIDLEKYSNDKIVIIADADGSFHCNELLLYNDSVTGKKYITHFVYNQGNDSSLNANNSAMYTFEIISEYNWKLIDYKLFSPVVYKAILPVYENSTIFAIHEYGCDTYSWDSVTNKYEKINSIDETMIAVGMDMNNNIFIQKGDTSLEIISRTVPTTIFADFVEDMYEFQTENIDTHIVVYAKNFENKFLNANIELQLIGNVRFTDDGTKIKRISTSNTGEIEIKVTITGPGMFQVRKRSV